MRYYPNHPSTDVFSTPWRHEEEPMDRTNEDKVWWEPNTCRPCGIALVPAPGGTHALDGHGAIWESNERLVAVCPLALKP